ncbi:MAG TPA: glycoside hydrolase family 2 protein [Anaerolineaceae bacterium]|nr:glycoside hydrolase family 2 protein [Anaerolineaceae bacterium]
MIIQDLTGAWQFRQAGSQDWLPATVPGGVHTDLMALEYIPDPFDGDNEAKVQWVAEADWEYQLLFTPKADLLNQAHIELVCDGLDTLAELSLNGELLGKADNMFRQYRFDLRPLLKEGANQLAIKFASPVCYCAERQAQEPMVGVSQALVGGPHLRKAPCQFGWDWGPQLPPIGIWKNIRLEAWPEARFEDVHLRQKHDSGKVTVSARLVITRPVAGYLAHLEVTSPDGGQVLKAETPFEGTDGLLEVEIDQPQLWWPNGYGTQPLYDVKISLEKEAMLLDQRQYKLGLRTIDLIQEPDEWGESFKFAVNGINIFAKGSNWIPTDSFPTRITRHKLEQLLGDAVRVNQNMLRVWGGGFYESEEFYDLCDQYGILVWQDFIFSCSMYPLGVPGFLENVHEEVVQNTRRLRHRTSLALWCGNNEMEEGWVDWQWDKSKFGYLEEAYDRFFHHQLKDWCQNEDPDRPYWPSSPSSGTPFKNPNGQERGDAHYWQVWHGRQPFTAYRQQFPRFMSEFGFQSLPPMRTVHSYASQADLNMTSYIMEGHQKNQRGNELIVSQMLDQYRLPKDFESLDYLSMVLQANGIRYGVEHWRRHSHRVAGTLYWQLNDCWPVASWSSLDYFGRWKALHYAARHFYAPVLLSIEDEGLLQKVFVTNDSLQSVAGTVQIRAESLAGQALHTAEYTIEVEPQVVNKVCELDCSLFVTGDLLRETVFIAEFWQAGQLVERKTAFFAPIKHLALADPGISATVEIEDGEARVTLKAETLALQVQVGFEGLDCVFSDNYFDLPANTPISLSTRLPQEISAEVLQSLLRVQTIYDSYAH